MTAAEEEFPRGKREEERLQNNDMDKGVELEKKAEAAESISTKAGLYHAAAIRYQLAKSWKKASDTLCKSANFYKEIGINKLAAKLFMDAGKALLKIRDEEALSCFNQAVEQLIDGKNIFQAALYGQKIGRLYLFPGQYDRSLYFYKRSADLFECIDCKRHASRSRVMGRRAAYLLKREHEHRDKQQKIEHEHHDKQQKIGLIQMIKSFACCCS